MQFIKDAWYVAAWSSELETNKLLARQILEQPIVMYRDAAGQPVALLDRCAHRFAPLSLGKIVNGNQVQCPYHGLEFGPDGHCTASPYGKTPQRARVKCFPIVEKYRAVWLWMGEDEPDAARIPNISAFVDDTERYRSVFGAIKLNADYQLVVDNLMDLSHAIYLHPDTLGSFEMIQRLRTDVRSSTEKAVEADLIADDVPPPAFWRRLLPKNTERVNWIGRLRWEPASNVQLEVAVTPVAGASPPGWPDAAMSAHLLTPESAESTHYFWTVARTTDRDSVEMDQFVYQMVTHAFTNEDAPMIEAQQQRIGANDIFALKPVLLPIDAPPMQVRAQVRQLLANEAKA